MARNPTRHWPHAEGLDTRMLTVAAIIGAATVAGGLFSSSQASNASQNASDAQSVSAAAGIAQQNKQFEAIQKLRAHKIGCLPVVHDDRVVGVVTERDFMDIAYELLEQRLGRAATE